MIKDMAWRVISAMQTESNICRVLVVVAALLLFASFQAPVSAHTPGPMTLSYDIGTQTLLVEVDHVVSGDHRVAQIQIWKNNEIVNTRFYDPPQETTSGMDDTFNFAANSGDVLKVTATCSVSGAITQEITVGSDTTTSATDTTDTTDTTPEIGQMVIYLGIAVAGAVIIIIVIIVRKMR